ncbi:MAG: thiamine pyrophosphate-dependent enzyme [Phycisphaerales bacterium]
MRPRARAGPCTCSTAPNHLYGGHGIVGSPRPPSAPGLAFAQRYKWEVLETGPKRVALCYLATRGHRRGRASTGLNLAAILSIPVIYIIENNGYSMGTAIHRHTANPADNLIERPRGTP